MVSRLIFDTIDKLEESSLFIMPCCFSSKIHHIRNIILSFSTICKREFHSFQTLFVLKMKKKSSIFFCVDLGLNEFSSITPFVIPIG